MSRLAWVLASFAVASVVAGCGGGSSPSAQLSATSPLTPASTSPPQQTVTTTATSSATSSASTSTVASTQQPKGGPAPAGFKPSSFTAISDDEWWLLGTAPCSTKPCTSIVRTTDGGQKFVGIPAPKTPLSDKGVENVRFGSASNGFAFGPQLWVTHDGGEKWTQLHIGEVTELAISDGYSYATVESGGRTKLEKSNIAGDSWSVLKTPSEVSGGLWVQGSNVFIQNASHNEYYGDSLLMSLNGGESWRTSKSPTGSLPCIFDQVTAPVLWEKCATGNFSHVYISNNNGDTFRDPAQGHESQNEEEFVNGALIGAASNTTAVVANEDQGLYRTTNSGGTFTKVGPAGMEGWAYIGFTDPDHGVAIGSAEHGGNKLFVSDDAGETWRRLSIS